MTEGTPKARVEVALPLPIFRTFTYRVEGPAPAVGTRVLVDAVPGTEGCASIGAPLVAGRHLFVAIDDRVHGAELWVTTGTSAHILRDIVPGSGSSAPSPLAAFGGRLFFSAFEDGAGIEPYFIRGEDPYAKSPYLALADLAVNKRLGVFPTRSGFGSNEAFDPAQNPLLAETPFMLDGEPMLANDVFRAVHDRARCLAQGLSVN